MNPPLYRIKKEAIPFIDAKYINNIYTIDTWSRMGLSENAIEEVKKPYVSYGINGTSSTSLGGWSGEKGSRFEFTIHFPSMKYKEYDEMRKGAFIREIMDTLVSDIEYKLSSLNIEADA